MGGFIQQIKCFFDYHAFSVIGRCGIVTHHIGCRVCKREWGMNHEVRALLPWLEVSGFHEDHGYDAQAHRRAWMMHEVSLKIHAADALAAGSQQAETKEDLAQCEASQSGPKGNAQTQSGDSNDAR